MSRGWREPARRADRPSGRRAEVERRLTELGLAARHPLGLSAEPESFARRLRRVLEELGPVFSLFGIYLGTRSDLLPPTTCLELAGIPDRGAASAPAAVAAHLAAELGRPGEALLAGLDPAPIAVDCLTQTHRARLPDGQAVRVQVIHPGIEESLETELDLVVLLGGIFPGPGGAPLAIDDVIADFRSTLSRRLDLAAAAEALSLLATGNPRDFAVPRMERELSTARVLVCAPLDDPLPLAGAPDLGRRLCRLWLRAVLLGPGFPVEPSGQLAALPDGRIAWTGGLLARPSAATQALLWEYLAAAAQGDALAACAHLLPELTAAGPMADADHLALRIRQVVPFREGCWSTGGDSLAEQLFAEWRVTRQCGFRPRPALLAFWRSTTAIAALARDLAGGRDVLREEWQELRLSAGLSHLAGMVSPGKLVDGLGPHATLFLEMPQKLDRVLSLLAAGEPAPGDEGGAGRGRQRQRDAGAAVLGLAMAAGAVALATGRLSSPALLGAWGERLGAGLFLLIGGLLLRAIARLR